MSSQKIYAKYTSHLSNISYKGRNIKLFILTNKNVIIIQENNKFYLYYNKNKITEDNKNKITEDNYNYIFNKINNIKVSKVDENKDENKDDDIYLIDFNVLLQLFNKNNINMDIINTILEIIFFNYVENINDMKYCKTILLLDESIYLYIDSIKTIYEDLKKYGKVEKNTIVSESDYKTLIEYINQNYNNIKLISEKHNKNIKIKYIYNTKKLDFLINYNRKFLNKYDKYFTIDKIFKGDYKDSNKTPQLWYFISMLFADKDVWYNNTYKNEIVIPDNLRKYLDSKNKINNCELSMEELSKNIKQNYNYLKTIETIKNIIIILLLIYLFVKYNNNEYYEYDNEYLYE
jgi:hypothetical protein